MAKRTLTRVQGGSTDTITIDTDKFAGVRTMTSISPLGDGSTEMQVTVTGTDSNGNDNSALSGTYTRANSTATSWNQVDGNGNIYLLNGVWNFIDGSDGTPNFTVTGSDKVPWQVASSFASNNVTLGPAQKIIKVDRTAPVIDSDRAGESRPLIPKLVGDAAAAYSLRDLNDKQGYNFIVDVRRDSDNTTESFRGKDIYNGTLEKFVSGVDGGFVNTGYESFSTSNTGFTAINTSNRGAAVLAIPAGDITNTAGVSVSFDISIVSGSPRLGLWGQMSGDSLRSSAQTFTTSGSHTVNLTVGGDYVGVGFVDNDPCEFTVSNFRVNEGNGFVERWHDQSGNGNDAIQTTISKQPQIVADGSLVTGGIDFLDGTNTHLDTTNSDICDVSQLSVFTVITPHTAGSQCQAFSCGSTVAGSTGYGGWVLNFNGYTDKALLQTQTKGTTSVTGVGVSVTGSESILSYVATFPNISGSANGGTAVTKDDLSSPTNNSTTRKRFRIGCQYTFQTTGFYTKPIKEIIIYTTDQTANQSAIEANLANQYGITLS